MKLGDAIKAVTEQLGIEQCAPCRKRQRLLNDLTSGDTDHVLDAVGEQMTLNALAPSVTSVTIAPPAAARRVAARALAVRKTLPPSRRGGLTTTQAHAEGIGSGVQRAVDIAAGRKVDAMRVHRFFQRFKGTVAKARAQGKTVHDSKAIMAWDLWGGDPMQKAVARAVTR